MTDDAWLRVAPLGGLGHIGGNMMVYETASDMIMVDCGVLFPASEHFGINYIIPDIAYVLERLDKLRGIVITHGHEDHIGALPFTLGSLPVPVYATRFTMALLRQKLSEYAELKPDLRPLRDRQKITLGCFEIDPLAVTHSIPDAVALAIRTPAGVIVHTGDFKIDPEPTDGRKTDIEGLREYGDGGVAILLSDSTNAEKSGHTWGEREVAQALHKVIEAAPYRVFITTFASHIDRIQAVLDGARLCNRRVLALGRSMQQNIAMAFSQRFLRGDPNILCDLAHVDRLERHQVVVLASGSQGEPFAAMPRIAAGRMKEMAVEPGDRLVLSSRRIPGNERAIGTMVNNFYRAGAEVISDHDARVHSSGHGFNDEQLQMMSLCRPRFFVPVHGEMRHMVRHAALAGQAGVAPERAMVTEDGHPLLLHWRQDGWVLEREGPIAAGLVFVDGHGVGDVGEVVLRDRRHLSEAGMLVCVIVLSGDGRLVAGPYLATRGLVYIDENQPLLERATSEVRAAVRQQDPDASCEARGEELRLLLRRFFRNALDRRPVVIPVVINLADSCCG